MSPKLFEFTDNGRMQILENAYLIEEIKDIIDKYGASKAEPYLAYCHLLSSFDSPIYNVEPWEKKELASQEVHINIGDFDDKEPLLDRAIERLTSLYTTPLMAFFKGQEEELHRILYYLRTNNISSEDLGLRTKMLENSGKVAGAYAAAKEQAEKEIKSKTRGDQATGTIR